MKKSILSLILVSCLIFFGINKANAYTITFGVATPTSNITLTAAQTAVPVMSFSLSPSTSRYFEEFDFTASGITADFSNFTLLRSATNNIGAATAVANTTVFYSGGTLQIYGFDDNIAAGGTAYYFITANYAPSTAGNFQITMADVYSYSNNAQTNGGNQNNNTTIIGPNFTVAQAVTVTLNSLGTAPTPPASPTNGLASDPLIAGQTNLPVYGFSLVGSGGGLSQTITGLSFFLPGAGQNYLWYNTMTLVSSTSSTYTAGAPTNVNVATYNVTNTGNTNPDSYANFTGLNITVNSGTTLYYFLVINTITSYSANFEEDYSSATGATITPGTTTTGYDYDVTTPYLTITNNTTGINTTNPYYYSSTGDVIESFGVTAVGPSTFTSFTLKTYIGGGNALGAASNFFTNVKLYSSTNPDYASDLAGTGSALVPVAATVSALTGTTITVTLPAGQTIGTTPVYYFIVADFTAGLNYPLPTQFQVRVTAAAGKLTSSGAALSVFPALPAPYTIFNLNSDFTFGTATTTGLASTNLYTSQLQVGLLGFSITTYDNQTIKTLTLTPTVSNGTMATYFANAQLYVSATNNFASATLVNGTTFGSLSGATFTITGLSQNINNTTLYYFIKADYTAPTTTTATFSLSVTNAINATPTTYTIGAPITSATYILSPPVLLGTATTTGFASNPLVGVQNGVGIMGFSLYSAAPNTFNTFTFTGTQNISAYFTGIKLYSSTTNSFLSATPVADPYTATVVNTSLVISGLNQSLTNTTVYYFIVVNYTPPTTVSTTFQLCLNSVTNTASVSYTNVAPCGTLYNLTSVASAPMAMNYYWAGGSNTGSDWKTATNWSTVPTAPYTNTGSYPGANSGDNAVFSATGSGTQTTPTPVLAAADGTITFNTLTVNSAVNPTITINAASAIKITTLTVSPTTGTTNLTIATGLLAISGVTTLGATASLTIPSGTVKFGTTVNLSGTTSAIKVTGGTVTAVTTAINLTGSGSTIALSNAGIFNATANGSFLLNAGANQPTITLKNTSVFNITSCPITFGGTSTTGASPYISTANNSVFTVNSTTIAMSGDNPEFIATSGTMNFNATTININGTTAGGFINGLTFAAGTINIGDGTAANASTINCSSANAYAFYSSNTASGTANVNLGSIINLSGNTSEIYSLGGNYNFNSATVNLTGANSEIYSDYYSTNTSIFTVNASTINLGSSANLTTPGTNGTGASLVNTDLAYFYLNAGSVINLYGNNTVLNNNYTTGFGGRFIAASTSAINPISISATVTNNINNPANYFTLLSDASGTATIGQLGSSAVVSGQYDIQRFISTASRNYRLLASPVNQTNYVSSTNLASPNVVNVYALSQTTTNPISFASYPGAFVGGPAGTGGGFTATTGGPCLYLYDESIVPNPATYNLSYYSGKNIAVTKLAATALSTSSTAVAVGGTGGTSADNSTTVVVPPGNGYLLYYIHDNTSTSTTAALNATATTGVGFVNQGTLKLMRWGSSGSLTTALTVNSGALGTPAYPGLTMVGNPYPSSIDLQQLYLDNAGASTVFTSGINESFFELNPTNEQFVTFAYDGTTPTTSGSNASRYIASGQGFYITVQNPGNALSFYEREKTSAAPSAILESYPVTNPVNSVDNVSHANSNIMADALIPVKTGVTNETTSASIDTVLLQKKNQLNNPGPTGPDTSKYGTIIAFKVKQPAFVRMPASPNTPPAFGTTPTTPVALAGLHLKLVQDSLNYDECGIYFSKKYSDALDNNDAPDLDGTGGKVFLSSYTSNRVRTSINAMSMFNATGKRIPLFVKYSASGLYSLGLEDIANFNKHYSVFLIDNMLKDSLDLTLYKSYNFNYTAGTAGDSTRFVLAIEHKPIPHYALVAFAGSKVTPGVKLSWTTLNEGNITTFILQKLSANNTYVFLDSLQSDSTGAYDYVDQHPTLGNNTYRLEQIDGLGAITYSAPVTIGYNSTNPNGGLVLYPNPAKSTMTVTLTTSSTAVQVATADIYNAQGKLIEHKVVNSNSFVHDVSAYDLGVYIIQLKNSNGVIVGNSKFVKVN